MGFLPSTQPPFRLFIPPIFDGLSYLKKRYTYAAKKLMKPVIAIKIDNLFNVEAGRNAIHLVFLAQTTPPYMRGVFRCAHHVSFIELWMVAKRRTHQRSRTDCVLRQDLDYVILECYQKINRPQEGTVYVKRCDLIGSKSWVELTKWKNFSTKVHSQGPTSWIRCPFCDCCTPWSVRFEVVHDYDLHPNEVLPEENYHEYKAAYILPVPNWEPM